MLLGDNLIICQVMLSAGFGGAERLFVDFCRALGDRGHQIQAVCHPDFKGLKLLKHRQIQVVTLKARIDWSPLAQFRFKKILLKSKPHLIHCHLARSASIAGSIGRTLGIPVAANLHNYINLKYYRKVDFFFPGTEDQHKYLENNGISSDRISVVPHFSLLPAKGISENPVSEPITFISYGRFVGKKGFHILLHAFKRLKERGFSAKLIIGGDGPEKQNLKKLIEELNLQQNVILHGWVDNVAKFLSKGSVFVLPSLDEPFGIVVLEAMSQGKVILSTLTKGPREIMDNETAYLFPPNDAIEMSNAMQQIFLDREKARLKSQAALAKFKRHYSSEKILPIFEAYYRKLIAQGNKRPIHA